MFRKCKKYARQKILNLIELRLKTYADEIDQKIERESEASKKREEEHKTEIRQCRKKIDRFYAMQVSDAIGYHNIDVMHEPAVSRYIADRRSNAQDMHFEQLGAAFETEIEKKITAGKNGSLVLVCCGWRQFGKYEAIRAEAHQIFLLLKQSTTYDVRFVTLESEQKEIEEDGGIVYAPESKLEAYFSRMNIHLVIAMEATAGIALMANGLFLKYPAMLRLSAQNPLEGVSQQAREALLHVNDLGMQHYTVCSKHAKKIMEQAGFKNIRFCYPLVDQRKISAAARMEKQEGKITAGFASSPMNEKQMADRGIFLLCDLIEKEQNAEFLVLWREATVALPDRLAKASNCKIIMGYYDMERFYSQIDCLLIPYASENSNHACSVSALEAMLTGVPVVCTSKSGVAELVAELEMGLVCRPEGESLQEALHVIREKRKYFCRGYQRRVLADRLDGSLFTDYVLKMLLRYVPDEITTLGEWSSRLESVGKYLVKGQAEIKKYYSKMEIAQNYKKERFVRYPQNCIDFLERKSVCAIINDKYGKRKQKLPELLDIAPGDGRITQESLKFGRCTAVDASAAMLDVLKERLGRDARLRVIHADYFEDTIGDQYDVVTTFRYLRHFEYASRKELYKKIHGNLKENGILIFDVPNLVFEMKLREVTGWENYNIYDMFWTKEDMVRELDEHGFYVEYVIAIGNGLMDEMPDDYKTEPVSWTFGAVRK